MLNLVKKWLVAFTLLTILFSLIACYSPPVADTSNMMMIRDGQVLQLNTVEKDYTILGLIFLESSATIDHNGNVIEGSKITFEMLMREAEKLGADDIMNLRIDEIMTTGLKRSTGMIGSGGVPIYEEQDGTVIYKANALAIKYIPSR